MRLTTKAFPKGSETWPVATEPVEFDGQKVGQHVFIEPPQGERIHVGQVSTDYALMPNTEATNTISSLIEKAGFTENQYWGTIFNGRKFQTTIVVDEGFEPIPNDRLNVGFRLTNSYDGSSKLKIEAMLFRVLCSNGMISSQLFGSFGIFHKGDNMKDFSVLSERLIHTFHNIEGHMEKIKEMESDKFNWKKFIPLTEGINNQFTGKMVHQLNKTSPSNMWEAFNNVTEMLNDPKSYGDINTLDSFTTNALIA